MKVEMGQGGDGWWEQGWLRLLVGKRADTRRAEGERADTKRERVGETRHCADIDKLGSWIGGGGEGGRESACGGKREEGEW